LVFPRWRFGAALTRLPAIHTEGRAAPWTPIKGRLERVSHKTCGGWGCRSFGKPVWGFSKRPVARGGNSKPRLEAGIGPTLGTGIGPRFGEPDIIPTLEACHRPHPGSLASFPPWKPGIIPTLEALASSRPREAWHQSRQASSRPGIIRARHHPTSHHSARASSAPGIIPPRIRLGREAGRDPPAQIRRAKAPTTEVQESSKHDCPPSR